MNNVLIGGDRLGVLRDRRRRAGRPAAVGAGMSGVHTAMTNTRNTPDRGARAGLPAAGAAPAAAAGERRRRARTPAATASSATSRCSRRPRCRSSPSAGASPPWGLDGGGPGAVGENWLLPGGDEAGPSRLPGQVHRRARGGRRRAHPHARRRRLGSRRTERARPWAGFDARAAALR